MRQRIRFEDISDESTRLLAELLQGVNPVPDHRAPPLGDPTDLVEDDAVVFPFNDP